MRDRPLGSPGPLPVIGERRIRRGPRRIVSSAWAARCVQLPAAAAEQRGVRHLLHEPMREDARGRLARLHHQSLTRELEECRPRATRRARSRARVRGRRRLPATDSADATSRTSVADGPGGTRIRRSSVAGTARSPVASGRAPDRAHELPQVQRDPVGRREDGCLTLGGKRTARERVQQHPFVCVRQRSELEHHLGGRRRRQQRLRSVPWDYTHRSDDRDAGVPRHVAESTHGVERARVAPVRDPPGRARPGRSAPPPARTRQRPRAC